MKKNHLYNKITKMKEKLVFPIQTSKHFADEKTFSSRFWRQIHSNWWFRHKISDMSIDAKPCDAVIWLGWYTCLCEIKVWNNKKKVDVYNLLRPNQKFWLRKRKENWWNSIVVYYSKIHHKYWVLNFSNNMELLLAE